MSISLSFTIGNIYITGQYVFFLLIIILILRIFWNNGPNISFVQKIYLVYGALALILPLFSGIIQRHASLGVLVPLLGNFRYLALPILISLCMSIYSQDEISHILHISFFIIFFIVFVFCIGQIYFPAQFYNISNSLFSDPKNPLIDNAFFDGVFYRAFGAFFSPVYLGIFALLFFTYIIGQMEKNGNKIPQYSLFLLIAMPILLAGFSKTVFLGIPIIIVIYSLFVIVQKKRLFPIFIVWLSVLLISILVIFPSILPAKKNYELSINYYYGFFQEFSTALDTRYSNILAPETTLGSDNLNEDDLSQKDTVFSMPETTGNLSDATAIIKSNLLFGVGYQPIKGEFISDSLFIKVLHNGGLLLLLTYGVFWGLVFFSALLKKDYLVCAIILGIGISGFAVAIFETSVALPFLVLILSRDYLLKNLFPHQRSIHINELQSTDIYYNSY